MRGKDSKEERENVREIHTTYDKEEEKGDGESKTSRGWRRRSLDRYSRLASEKEIERGRKEANGKKEETEYVRACVTHAADRISLHFGMRRDDQIHDTHIGNEATGEFRDPENEDTLDRRRHTGDSVGKRNVFDRPGEPWSIFPIASIRFLEPNVILSRSHMTINTS